MQLSLSTIAPSAGPADLSSPSAATGSDENAEGFSDLIGQYLGSEAETSDDPTDAAAAEAATLVVGDLLAALARPTVPPSPIGLGPIPGQPGDAAETAATGSTDAEPDPRSAPTAWPGLITGARPVTPSPELAANGSGSPVPPGNAPAAASPDLAAPLAEPLPAATAARGAATAETGEATARAGAPESAAAADSLAETGLSVPLAHPATLRLRGEKIADSSARSLSPRISGDSEPNKNFLNVEEETDANAVDSVGIDVAKREVFMNSPQSTSTPTSALRGETGAVSAIAEAAAIEVKGGESPAPMPAESTREIAQAAVAAVVKAVERAEAAPRTAVNLQFSVGGADLVVKIEHRADEIRATFRTDSGELRSALASEWQVAVGSGSEHALRRVEPVFTTAGSSGENARSSSDQGSLSQHPSQQQHAQREAGRDGSGAGAAAFAALLRRPTTSAATDSATTAPRPAYVPTSVHLQTFA